MFHNRISFHKIRKYTSYHYGSLKVQSDAYQAYMVGLSLNLLNPTGHVTHQQFNIQQLYALPTLYLCVLYLSENKQRLVPLTA